MLAIARLNLPEKAWYASGLCSFCLYSIIRQQKTGHTQPSVATSILEALGDSVIGEQQDLEIRSALGAAFGGESFRQLHKCGYCLIYLVSRG